MDNKITIGARGSKLSLAYANKVKSNILSQVQGIDKEIIIKKIKTSGDLFQNKKISEIGGKDLFCKEIEEKLIKKEIDIAVHSLKDMDSEETKGLTIHAYLERNDARETFVSKSFDDGRSWSKPKPLHNHIYKNKEESESLKPLLLQNNKLLAIGYAFVRPDSLTPIVNPNTFEILPLNNKISISNDNGESWSMPKNFNVNETPLEISGPCIQLKSGRILGAAPPFHLKESDHSGWIIYSDDEGENWSKLSEFYKSKEGHISTWECRLCETNNKIIVIFWAYDNKNKKNLSNHVVISDDAGKTFNTVIDTKIRGQASNVIFYKDDIIVISSRGVLAFKKNIEDTEENFQQIKNNINDFIGADQFKKNRNFIFVYLNCALIQ